MVKKLLVIFIATIHISFFAYADSLPLEGKRFGVEFNIPRVLTYSDDWKSVSGTFSWFDHENKVEIAVPWLISADKETDYHNVEIHMDVVDVDIHYRKFLGEELGGFYMSSFGRVSYLNGLLDREEQYKKTTKFGLGVGLGYRFFPKTQRYYWGVGLIVGRYIIGDNDIYREVGFGIEDSPYIVDIELLKFGYAF